VSEERRHKRREISLLQSESVWLQKALFALRKAEAVRGKLADARDEEMGSYTLTVGDQRLPLEDLEDGLEDYVEDLIRKVREMRRSLR
jgi:hypothetical protein